MTTDSVTSLYPLHSDAAKNVGADQYFSEMMGGVFVAILLSQLSDALHTARILFVYEKVQNYTSRIFLTGQQWRSNAVGKV